MDGPLAIIPLVLMICLPLVAIVGGITAGIVKTTMRQRMLELAQKERIAAIERGIDPERLPPIRLPEDLRKSGLTMEQRALRRSHLLAIWGLITVFFGLAMVGIAVTTGDREAHGPGAVFGMIGLGLLAASRVGRPTAEEVRRSVERATGTEAA